MKKILLIAALVVFPVSAHADFSLIGLNKATPSASVKRSVKKPALEIINERFIPDEIQQKYSAPVAKGAMELPLPEAKAEPIPLRPMDAPLEIAAMPPTKAIVVTPPKALIVEDAVKPVPPAPLPAERHETWRARKGEYVKEVLKRWSDRAETEFVWTASKAPKVAEEFSYVGTFQDAAGKLLAQNPTGLKTKFADDVNESVNPIANNIPTGPQPLPTPIVDDQIAYRDMSAPAPAAPVVAHNWTATKGASVEAVLKEWADKEGASVVWQAGEAKFDVKAPVVESGPFETAVSALLTQYDAQKVRPVGQLYKNPISGEKVLVVREDKLGG